MSYIYDLTDTWNAGGTTFNGIKLNVTDSASAVSSKLVTLQTNGTEHFSVTKAGVGYVSGNLGVGTATPAYKLDVVGDASFGAAIITGRGVSTGDVKIELGANRSDAGPVYIDFHALAGQDYNGRILRVGGTNGSFEIVNAGTGAMTFSTNNGERMRIDGSSGNVGIGTASPAGKLHVNSTVDGEVIRAQRAGGTNLTLLRVNMSETNNTGTIEVTGAAGNPALVFATVGSERARIESSGSFLVGTTTQNDATTAKLNLYFTTGYALTTKASSDNQYHVVFDNAAGSAIGSIYCTATATAYNTSSDYRLKDIDGPVANSGAYIDALKPVQGSWKADGSRFIGLLAHEVQEVSETPIATGEKDGEEMQAMDYSAPELIANLIAEIQSLRARVAQLEGK